jgi:hypothetical protein
VTDRRPWFAFGAVLALLATLSAYYWVHKPVTPAQAVAVAGGWADLGTALLLTLLGGGLGRRLLRGWLAPSPGERITLQAALGWGVMGLALLGLGLARLYYPALMWALTLVALLVLWREVRGWLADFFQALRVIWFPSRVSRLAASFVLFMLALGLLRALAPPLKWDALVYHLTLPKLYAQTHGVRLPFDLFFTGMPHLTEMLYTAATLLRGATAAQALGWVFGALLALGLAAHASELLGAQAAALPPAILFSALTMALSLAWAYVDLLLMLYAVSVLIALRQWALHGDRRWLWLGGVMAGCAVSCKYTGVVVPLAGAMVIGFYSFAAAPQSSNPALPSESIRRLSFDIRHSALMPRPLSFLLLPSSFLLISCLTISPWLVKNWVFTGSPVYPLLIPTEQVDALRQWFYNRPDLIERNPLWAALIFFRAVFLGVQGGNSYDATLGPLWIVLPLWLALGWRRLGLQFQQALKPLVVFALAGYGGWAALMYTSAFAVQPRLFFGLFVALAILCAGGLAAAALFDSPTLRVSLVLNAGLALVLGLSAFENLAAFSAHNPLAYLVGQQSASDYRAAHLGWYAVALERVNALPNGARVTFLWEARSLECALPERCRPDEIIDRWWHLRRTLGSADAIRSRWQADGTTHVLIYDAGADFVRSQPDSPFEASDWVELDVLRARLRLVESLGGAYSLYALP